MGRRTLLLIAAFVVAALGTVLVFMYAQNAKNAASDGQAIVKVLVAKTQIEVGTTGATASANGAFEQKEVPQSSVVAGALSDAAPLSTLVALVPVFAGQQIIAAQWGATNQISGIVLPPGTIAIQVQLGDVERVGGYVTPGSQVAIFTTGTQPASAGTPAGGVARVLVPKATVLAVGSATATSGQSGSTSGTQTDVSAAILTLAVTQDQFQKILFVTKTPQSPFSGLTLALLGKDSKIDPANQGATVENLFK
jgi:pilus assembly protein CpaB